MRKITLYFMSLALVFGAASAKTYSDKTFLMPRDQITNLAMEYATWHKQIHREPDAQYNGTVQAIGFYQESTNKTDIGEYFGFKWICPNSSECAEVYEIKNEIGVANSDVENASKYLFQPRFIIHDYANSDPEDGDLKANYKFEPYQEVYGAKLSYHQDLDKILSGLFFRFNSALVEVRNNMNLECITESVKQDLPDVNPAKSVCFLDYLSGNVVNRSENNNQDPLRYAKIDGASHSASGIADIEAVLGYTLWHKKRSRIDLFGGLVIPTGKTPKGEFIFEPIHGNAHHWAVEVGLDSSFYLWQRENKSIELLIAAKYKYLFEGIEKRTLDFNWVYPGTNEKNAALYYYLGAEVGGNKTFPLANVLTQDIKVLPGSNLDAILAIACTVGGLTFDIGYNVFYKEEERVNLKTPWENDKYAVAAPEWDTNTAFDLTDPTKAYGGAGTVPATNPNFAIQKDHLDYSSIKSPYQVTHKVYGALGYDWYKSKYPVMIAVGGSYEYCERNAALEGWAAWGKFGLSW